MLLIVEEGIKGGICHATHTESSYLAYLDGNNLYGYAMLQKLPVDSLKWIEKDDLLKFDENFIKNYDKNSDIFLKYM